MATFCASVELSPHIRESAAVVLLTLAIAVGVMRSDSAPTRAGIDIMPGHRTFRTTFRREENPISEGGKWISAGKAAIDWADVATIRGLAYGMESGKIKYDDSTALVAGPWRPDQSAEATVHSVNQTDGMTEEVEIRLRSSLSPHRATGYEILFRCSKTKNSYTQIVRWNGPLGDFTYLASRGGSACGVAHSDVVKATIAGNVITAYVNGKQVLQATDDTFKEGSPGIGFYLEGDPKVSRDYGFTRFAAWD